jgi:uncharacterized LabA/DUF88 family protein
MVAGKTGTRSYLFIDGGYLREICRDVFGRIFRADNPKIDFANVLSATGCAKAFYYDCIDEQRKDEDHASFSVREKAQKDQFNSIRSLPGFHVIEGTLSGRRQKEVDVALAVDMLTHAFNHNMGWVHLMAGDLDFRPLVQALVGCGVYVTVWSRQSSGSTGLRWAADDSKEITVRLLHSWCTKEFMDEYPLPVHTGDQLPPEETISQGEYRGGARVVIFQDVNPPQRYVIRVLTPQPFRVVHSDRRVLEAFFDQEYGKVEWR